MSLMKEVEKAEFDTFLAAYPRPLQRHVTTICEPPLISYNDWERAPLWPDSVVASFTAADPRGSPEQGYRVLKDINSPVPDDGKRDTDEPLTDSLGAELKEGDRVLCQWGGSFDGGRWTQDQREETILIREKGTKYEHWSFESCHNYVKGRDMVKIQAASHGVED